MRVWSHLPYKHIINAPEVVAIKTLQILLRDHSHLPFLLPNL